MLELLDTAKNDLEDVAEEESQSDKPEGEADDTSLGQSPDDAPPSVKAYQASLTLNSHKILKHERNEDKCLGLPDGSRCR